VFFFGGGGGGGVFHYKFNISLGVTPSMGLVVPFALAIPFGLTTCKYFYYIVSNKADRNHET
jgi:hypothetical protein